MALSKSPAFPSSLNVLNTGAFLLLVRLIFVFALFSFLIFFLKDVFKVVFFHSPHYLLPSEGK